MHKTKELQNFNNFRGRTNSFTSIIVVIITNKNTAAYDKLGHKILQIAVIISENSSMKPTHKMLPTCKMFLENCQFEFVIYACEA